jgi:Tfp pilus assembly protein PilF
MIRVGRGHLAEDDTAHGHDHVSKDELRLAEIMAHMLRAALASASGRTEQALEEARAAARLEDEGVFQYGPPPTVKPPHELLGELLLKAGRPAEARAELEKTLERTPNRRLTLAGLARAGG